MQCRKCKKPVEHELDRYVCTDTYCDWWIYDEAHIANEVRKYLNEILSIYPYLGKIIENVAKSVHGM